MPHPDSYLSTQNWVCFSWANRAHIVHPSPQEPSREHGSQSRCLIHAVAGPGSTAWGIVALLFPRLTWVWVNVNASSLYWYRINLFLYWDIHQQSYRALTGIEFWTCHLFMIPNLNRNYWSKWKLQMNQNKLWKVISLYNAFIPRNSRIYAQS